MCIRDRLEDEPGLVVDRAVGPLEDVEQHGAVLGDDVHQHFDDVFRALEWLAHVVEPVADAGVGLPWIGRDAGQLALFDVEHAHAMDLRAALLLGVDGEVRAVRGDGGVVQIGRASCRERV